MKWIVIFMGVCSATAMNAQDTLWIVPGTFIQGNDTMPALRAETQASWTGFNAVIDREANTDASIVVFNADSVAHTWSTNAPDAENVTLPAGATVNVELPSLPQGSYQYFLNDEQGKILGAGGLLRIGWSTETLFYWNLREWQPSMMELSAAGEAIDWSLPYVPRHFTINERSYPSTGDDPNAYVAVNLNDTCYISISNFGHMNHVLHFHGFHVDIISATDHPERVGWNKDTVPIRKGESLTVRLVAFQAGMYPVHNHNLIAVTNAGFYPGGMITTINVMP
tara:strand:- start:1700 stop:2542 length:843 start_codon:yes stop_codon:yes gene_type:complete